MAMAGVGIREHKMSLDAYVREKLAILRELQMQLSLEQLKHLKSLENEIQVDNYVHDLIVKRK